MSRTAQLSRAALATIALLYGNGAPVAGTSEVVTLTFGGTITSGTFKLTFEGRPTAAISWSATNATLVANIDAALEALGLVGAGNVTTAVGTMTAGIGTITLTFAAALGKKDVPAIGVLSSLVGTNPTLAATVSTPGVDATGRGAPTGSLYVDLTTPDLYINAGTPSAPVFKLFTRAA
jgi:hypothetical protein